MANATMPRILAGVALVGLVTATAAAQGFVRTDVTDMPGFLIMNGLVAKTDANETDFSVVDIDLDGDMDVVCGRKTPFTGSVVGLTNVLFLNDGFGVLSDETAAHTSFNLTSDLSREVDVGDVNNDGWPDVVFFNTENQASSLYYNLGNDAQGNWLGLGPKVGVQIAPVFNFCGGALLDYDLDGLLDMYRVDYSSGANPSNYGDDLLRQSPPGTFTNVRTVLPNMPSGQVFYASGSFGTRAQAHDPSGGILDMNGDGLVDILVIGSGKARIAYSDGVGGFIAASDVTTVGTDGGDVYDGIAGDFDGDGDTDFFKVRDGTDIWVKNNGNNPNGTMIQSASEVVGGGAGNASSSGFGANPKAVDFDGDGDLDVFVSPIDPDIPNCSTRRLLLWENVGLGNVRLFEDSHVTWPMAVFDMAIADFDGDGVLDMLMSGCNPEAGFTYYRSDPNAGNFRSELTPLQNGGTEFKVSAIPDWGSAFRKVYNFFTADLSQPLGSGPFLGMPAEVIPQAGFGPPFNVNVASGQEEYIFNIPPLGAPITDIRQRSVAVDLQTGEYELAEILEVM